jgi:hypothetical protein
MTERKFHFSLTEQCQIKNLENSQEVEFIIENKGNKRFLTGFLINTKDPSEDVATFNATRKAINLSNFIGVRYWHYVRPILEGFSDNQTITKYSKHGWLHINDLNFDSNDRAVVNILNDIEKNILYEHVSRALKAADDEDPVTIIRELYHVVEKNTPIHLNKFRSLRDVLSHKGPISPRTIQKLENGFGMNYFTFTPNGDFDYTSPENIKRLETEARYLMGQVLVLPSLTS